MINGSTQTDLALLAQRVTGYESADTTSELFEFGKLLLPEEVDRAHWIDSKASTLAGFCGAVVALLLSTLSSWTPILLTARSGLRACVFIGIIAVMFAGTLAFLAIFNRTFTWIDETDEWFPFASDKRDYLDYPEQLKRFHILTMYNATKNHAKKNKLKMRWVTAAQTVLLIGIILLALPSLSIIFRTLWP